MKFTISIVHGTARNRFVRATTMLLLALGCMGTAAPRPVPLSPSDSRQPEVIEIVAKSNAKVSELPQLRRTALRETLLASRSSDPVLAVRLNTPIRQLSTDQRATLREQLRQHHRAMQRAGESLPK